MNLLWHDATPTHDMLRTQQGPGQIQYQVICCRATKAVEAIEVRRLYPCDPGRWKWAALDKAAPEYLALLLAALKFYDEAKEAV